MFFEVKKNRASEDVIFQVQEAIITGKLKEGDRLPSERNLRNIFKISRGTLREALRTLEQKGLIAIKVGAGGGAFVCSADTKRMSESLDLLVRLQKITLKELIEFRETVEGVVAAKAAQNAKKEEIEELTSLLELIKTLLKGDEVRWSEIAEADRDFHASLARIAGNRVFESVLYTIYDNIDRYFDRVFPRKRWILERNYADLCRIAEAIRKRNPEEAKLLAERHVRLFGPMMEEHEKRLVTENQNSKFA